LDLTVVSVGYLLPFPNGDFVRVACKSIKAVRDGAKKHKAFIALEESIVCLVAANDQQHFQEAVQELVLQHILPSPHITVNLQALSKAIHTAIFGLQGITFIIFSASCRWPAWPRRSTMQV